HDLGMHRIGPLRARAYCDLRLERHATLRAVPWSALPDLRVHRAGVDPVVGRHAVTLAGPSRACRASRSIWRRHQWLYGRASIKPTIRQQPERGNSLTIEIVRRDEEVDSGSTVSRISQDAMINSLHSPIVRQTFSRGGMYFVTDSQKSIDKPIIVPE